MGMFFARLLIVSVAVVIGFIASCASLHGAEEAAPEKPRAVPLYRIDTTDFNASEADIRAICDSAAKQLWRHFPDYDLEPFVVTRGKSGPIVLFQRNDAKEIVLRLDTSDTFWSQYAYQFGHEFCHILSGFKAGGNENLWFEETLCEMASLYVLRGMARDWKKEPPYKHWADYRDSLRGYADDVIVKRKHVREINTTGLATFQQKHADELRKNPTNRDLNGAMAVILLPLFEAEPEHWEAIRWLNQVARPADESFAAYLTRWHAAVPERHQAFVQEIAKLYSIEIPAAR
jgi:hypothetical protein